MASVVADSRVGKYPIDPELPNYYEIEKIHIPPSTELIPDEYEHEDNRNGLVLIFYSKYDENSKQVIAQEFNYQGYDVSEDNIFKLSTKNQVLGELSAVSTGDNEDKSCLIIFFLGMVEKGDKFLMDEEDEEFVTLKDIWTKFTSDSCISFRNKPKIFIFQVRAFDAHQIPIAPKGAYSVPSEADILIVYKKIEDLCRRGVFARELCNQINEFGKKDDIIGLVTRTNMEQRPLIISTLTRKFYIAKTPNRGLYYELECNHNKAMEILRIFQTEISNPGGSHVTGIDTTKKKTLTDGKSKFMPKLKTKQQDNRPPWR
ncbi:hypothetical protein FQA39_LY16010 [Lamprigera yunnana]|nr:hypothetical protein FQA39_LY16010 [Lamprigera yunnana]